MPTGVVLITGGGRGIGAAIARHAAAEGYIPVVTYKSRADEAARLVETIRASGGHALAVQSDASREDEIVRAFEAADAVGTLVGLVNNAGATGGSGTVMNLRQEQLEAAFGTNAMGSFLCAREAVRRMARSRGGAGGAIVSISSAAARTGSPNYWVHYAASKAAVDVMTIGLAKEVAADGIRVNAIRPGVIDTEIHAAAPPDVVARMTQAIPMKRLGQPDEVARLAVWLLGEQASYVTGALIDAGGGY